MVQGDSGAREGVGGKELDKGFGGYCVVDDGRATVKEEGRMSAREAVKWGSV